MPVLGRCLPFLLGLLLFPAIGNAQPTDRLVPRFQQEPSGPVLERPAEAGTFLDVVGRRSGLFGYENETFEAWVYPLKILKDFRLEFEIEGYPLPYDGRDLMTHVEARPEATVLTYTHAAFTVRQIIIAPVHEPGLVMLLDVNTARPLSITGVFRPDLELMWPSSLPTPNGAFDAEADHYTFTVTGQDYAAAVGAPGAEDVSLMPYQEEPRDVPVRFTMDATPSTTEDHLLPLVIAGSMEGANDAQQTYDRLLENAPSLYQKNVDHYGSLLDESLQIDTPDDRLDEAFTWALVGMEKGMVNNPMLGTGLIAGYRTAGASERPGFAWFFGRDALWTSFALTAAGDVDATRSALDFLAQFQRDDGKIPHEISQSAALIDWFEDFPYPWASADATPLYIIAHEALYATTGDEAFLQKHWSTLKKAYRFSAATDTDGNHLLENTDVGHGWVEGGALYPAHEELYMQGLWIEAAQDFATLAEVMGENRLAKTARSAAEQTQSATEETYWLPDAGHYAFATKRPDGRSLYRQNTVLPAVPMWWGTLDAERAQSEVDHLGSGSMATDWGHRIVSSESTVYDPLSYHHGSVWPLFTGWASMGAYEYTRPHVGYQGLMSSALLTEQDALGYVTELLSGDYNTAFGRTSHHQIWSEAMVVTPVVRGLLGIEGRDAGQTLHVAPQLPAGWDSLRVQNVPTGASAYDLDLVRSDDAYRVTLTPQEDGNPVNRIVVAPALPRDAEVRGATVNGSDAPVTTEQAGDRMRARVTVGTVSGPTEVVIERRRGSDVLLRADTPSDGATNQGLRVLRSTAGDDALTVVLEGRVGETYRVPVRSPRTVQAPEGVDVVEQYRDVTVLSVSFEGAGDRYVRRTLDIGLDD